MKFKGIVSKILACTMVVTTVFTGNVTNANANTNANDQAMVLEPIAKYDFETEDNYKDIQKVNADLSAYTGDFSLQTELDNAVKSGVYNTDTVKAFSTRNDKTKHGLKIPQSGLADYTVSLWMWREWNSLDSSNNTPYVLMSIGTESKYVTLGNNDNSRSKKNMDLLYNNGETVTKTNVYPDQSYWANSWRMVTLTQSGSKVTVYVGGEKKLETEVEGSMLAQEGSSILIGAQQNKSGSSACLFDEINIYDVALNAEQVTQLFNGKSVTETRPEKILEAKGISALPAKGIVMKNGTLTVQAVLPEGVPADTDGLEVSYESANTAIATVGAATGVVTPVAEGTAKITVKAKIGSVTKTAEVDVIVVDGPEGALKVTDKINVPENITCAVNGEVQIEMKLPDGVTGNDATVSYAVSPDDGGVAEVDNSGKVKGKKAGDSQVVTSVTIGSTTKTGITAVKVVEASKLLEAGEITVTPSIKIKGTATVQVEMDLPDGLTADNPDVTLTCESSDTDVATVNNSGQVTGVTPGKAVITTTVTAGSGDDAVTKTAYTNVRVIRAQADAEVAVEYDLSAADNGKLIDISGNDNDGVIRGGNYSFVTADDGRDAMVLGDETYVELPKTIADTLTSKEKFTISARFAKGATNGTNSWLFCFGADVQKTAVNYLFLCPDNGGKLRSGIKNDTKEHLFASSKVFNVDEFYTVDLVFNEGKIMLFVDGVQIKSDGGSGYIDSGYRMEDILNANKTEGILGYIGKSIFSDDKYFQGKLSSFKIYNSAKTADDIQGDYQEEFRKNVDALLTAEAFAGYLGSKNPSLDKVAYDLSLPKTLGEYDVTWSSVPEGIVAADGKVYNDEEADKEVKLTATVSSGSLTATKEFTVTVLKADRTALKKAIEDAKAVDTKKYTDASVRTLTRALTEAQAETLKGQTRIDSAATKLNNAIKNLKEAPVTTVEVTSVTLDKATLTLTVDQSETLKATVNPAEADQAVAWESSKPDVASVVGGKVTAKKEGTAVITVTSTADKSKTATCAVTVKAKTVAVKNVKLNVKKLTMGVKESYTLKATVDPSNASNKKVTWKSDKPKIVDVKNGKITAKKTGKAKITVTSSADKKKSATITVTVKKAPDKKTKVTLNKKTVTLKVKKTFQIKAKVSSKYGSATFKYTIDKKGKKAVKVDKNGKVTAKKKGKATITVKPYNGKGKSAKVKITVK